VTPGAPRVAVVIVNYNAGEHLPGVLADLGRQTRRPDRTIVVDNASSDGSDAVVERDFPDVELVRAGANLGFAAGNNRGVELAHDCDFIALLNPDAYPEPGWLEELLRAADEEPGFRFSTSRMVRATHPDELDGTGDVYHASGLAWRRDHGRPAAEAPDADRRQEVFGACAAAALYRREDFVALGGFDEAYFAYMEDVDLSFRLRLAGHRCLYVPESVVRHVGSATTGYESEFTVFLSHRNLVWTWVKNMPGPLLALYLPHHLAVNALTIVWFATRGRGRAVLRSKRAALRDLPRVWAQRRTIQRSRQVGVRELRRHLSTGAGAYTTALSRAVAAVLGRR
jgi:GT2 family glycosyltransferase